MHLDKAHSGGWSAPISGIYADAERAGRELAKNLTTEDVIRRASQAVERAVKNGVGFIRTNVNVNTNTGLTGLHGILEVRKRYADLVDIEIVALPGGDFFRSEKAEALLRHAVELGADVIGGSPRMEIDDEEGHRHIDKVFDIAKQHSKRIDMHIDAVCDPNLTTIHYLAAKTIREGFEGRVTAGHVVALSYYNDYYAERVISLIKRAGIHVVTCPATTMISAPMLDKEPRTRGVTRIRQLLSSGVNVAIGQDNIDDNYNPFGDADPLTNGLLTAYAGLLSTDDELESLCDMLSLNGARVLGVAYPKLAVGESATFNILNATTLREAFRNRVERSFVLRAGRVVATTTVESKLYRAQ
jgi:cytosine/creatinine deaminase